MCTQEGAVPLLVMLAHLRTDDRAESAVATSVGSVGEVGDLLGDQPDQEHDDRCAPQQRTHVGQAAGVEVGVQVVDQAQHEKQRAEPAPRPATPVARRRSTRRCGRPCGSCSAHHAHARSHGRFDQCGILRGDGQLQAQREF